MWRFLMFRVRTCTQKMPDDKRALMVLRGDFADIMCQVNPEYERFTKGEGKNKVLYLHLLGALYGCIESALLWYNIYIWMHRV